MISKVHDRHHWSIEPNKFYRFLRTLAGSVEAVNVSARHSKPGNYSGISIFRQ